MESTSESICMKDLRGIRHLWSRTNHSQNWIEQGSLTERERLNTVDLIVLTSLDELLFIFKMLFTFFTKQVTLMRRSTVLSLPLS